MTFFFFLYLSLSVVTANFCEINDRSVVGNMCGSACDIRVQKEVVSGANFRWTLTPTAGCSVPLDQVDISCPSSGIYRRDFSADGTVSFECACQSATSVDVVFDNKAFISILCDSARSYSSTPKSICTTVLDRTASVYQRFDGFTPQSHAMFITDTSKATFHVISSSSPTIFVHPTDAYLPSFCDELYVENPTALEAGEFCQDYCKATFLADGSDALRRSKQHAAYVPPSQEPTPSSSSSGSIYLCNADSLYPLCARQTRAAGCTAEIVRRRSQTDASKPAFDEWTVSIGDGCPGDADPSLEVLCPTGGKKEYASSTVDGRDFSFVCDCEPASFITFVFGGQTAAKVACADYDDLAVGQSTPPRNVCGGATAPNVGVTDISNNIFLNDYYGLVSPSCSFDNRAGACLSKSACDAAGSSEWVASSDGASGCTTYGSLQCCVGVAAPRLQHSVSPNGGNDITVQPFTSLNSNVLQWGDFCDTLSDAVENLFERPGFCVRRCNEIADANKFVFRGTDDISSDSSVSTVVIVSAAVAAACCVALVCIALVAVVVARSRSSAAHAAPPLAPSSGRRSRTRTHGSSSRNVRREYE